MNIAVLLINILILLIMPFIMLGIIKKTKAFWGGRKGVCVLQPLYDFLRLIKKKPVYGSTTSFVFRLAPVITLASVIFAGAFVPLAGGYSVINMEFGFIIFAYVLGLGKFFSLLGAMDTGSSFEGMGASREACFSTFVEPAFFIILASVCTLSGIFNFQSLNMFLHTHDILGFCIIILAVFAFLVMLLTECSRVPVDDPATHLELTMIHEVMILDNSGSDLAFLTWASGIKAVIISSLIATLLIPFDIPYVCSLILYLLVLTLVSALIGTVEAGMARFRMSHIFEFVFSMTATALIILALITIRMYGY